MTRVQRAVTFEDSGDPRYPYDATVDGARWQVRMNDFPAQASLYSLIVDGEVVEELVDWPAAWTRPPAASARPPVGTASPDDPHECAEDAREQAQLARTRGIAPSKLVT